MGHVHRLPEFPLSDYPSRGVDHALLVDCCRITTRTFEIFAEVVKFIQRGDDVLGNEGCESTHPPLEKRVPCSMPS